VSHFDHAGDAAADFALVKSMSDADPERNARYLRHRIAAAAWIPGLLLVIMLGQLTRSLVMASAGMVILIAVLLLYALKR
jgi:hypothetical protein